MQFQVTPMDDGIRAATDDLSLQNAVFAAVETGCRRVVIPGDKNWTLTQPCRIPSDFVLELDGCTVNAECGCAFTNAHADTEAPSLATEDHDIVICGQGRLLCGGVKLFNVKDFRLSGFTVENAEEAVRLEYSYGGFVDDLTFAQVNTGMNVGCGVHDIVTNHLSGNTVDSFVTVGETGAVPVMAKRRNISDLIFTGMKAHVGAGAFATFHALTEGVFKTVLMAQVEIAGNSPAAFRFAGETRISGVTVDDVRFGDCGTVQIAAPLFQCAFLRVDKGIELPTDMCTDVLVQEV